MRLGWRHVRRFAWLPAAALCWVGWSGIAPLEPGHNPNYPLVGAPHLLLVVVTVWASRVNWAAVTVALFGGGLAAYLPWAEQAGRQTEGFEWRFNNMMGAVMCCGAGYGVLFFTSFVVFACSVLGHNTEVAKSDTILPKETDATD